MLLTTFGTYIVRQAIMTKIFPDLLVMLTADIPLFPSKLAVANLLAYFDIAEQIRAVRVGVLFPLH
jgi:hypothetical protein